MRIKPRTLCLDGHSTDEGALRTGRWGAVYGVCCLLGLGTLLPWNVFITEKQYFDVRVQQPPTQPALADNFENIIVVSFQILCVAALPPTLALILKTHR